MPESPLGFPDPKWDTPLRSGRLVHRIPGVSLPLNPALIAAIPSGMKMRPLPEPGGFPDISRWLRSNATTPPVWPHITTASRREMRQRPLPTTTPSTLPRPIRVHLRSPPSATPKALCHKARGCAVPGATPGMGGDARNNHNVVVPKDRTGGLTSTVRGALVATYRGVFHSAASGHLPRISRVCCCGTTRSGLSSYPPFTHGSTSAVQPWASWQNPVGIPGGMPARRACLPPHRLQTNGWDPAGVLVPFRPQPGVSLPLNPGLTELSALGGVFDYFPGSPM